MSDIVQEQKGYFLRASDGSIVASRFICVDVSDDDGFLHERYLRIRDGHHISYDANLKHGDEVRVWYTVESEDYWLDGISTVLSSESLYVKVHTLETELAEVKRVLVALATRTSNEES